MNRRLFVFLMCISLTVPVFAGDGEKEKDRLEDSAAVMKEVLGMPDSIPKDLMKKAACVMVFPSVKKGAIGIGGSYGRGVMTCRTGEEYTGGFTGAAMYAIEGASIGFQIGGQATDFILLIMNPRGAKSVLTSKVKLGADASIAGGPKGRTASAETDVVARAEILSYSRAKGLFAGVSLAGSTLRSDGGANKNLYGRELSAKDILRDHKAGTPAAASKLIAVLNGASGRKSK